MYGAFDAINSRLYPSDLSDYQGGHAQFPVSHGNNGGSLPPSGGNTGGNGPPAGGQPNPNKPPRRGKFTAAPPNDGDGGGSSGLDVLSTVLVNSQSPYRIILFDIVHPTHHVNVLQKRLEAVSATIERGDT